jgi:sortase A
MVGRAFAVVAVTVLAAALGGCSEVADSVVTIPSVTAPAPRVTVTTKPVPSAVVPPSPRRTRAPTSTVVALSIPSIQVADLRVVAYNGTADDRPGTQIQNQGMAASPRGPRGGVGPGQLGNFIITGHRTTHGHPFGQLPEVRNGEHILITSGGLVHDYVVTATMTISFRLAGDVARQNAAVPGRPGERPTQAMITLSTCATPEDHAQGNYWKDALGNPEHRINKIGVLVGTRPA